MEKSLKFVLTLVTRMYDRAELNEQIALNNANEDVMSRQLIAFRRQVAADLEKYDSHFNTIEKDYSIVRKGIKEFLNSDITFQQISDMNKPELIAEVVQTHEAFLQIITEAGKMIGL